MDIYCCQIGGLTNDLRRRLHQVTQAGAIIRLLLVGSGVCGWLDESSAYTIPRNGGQKGLREVLVEVVRGVFFPRTGSVFNACPPGKRSWIPAFAGMTYYGACRGAKPLCVPPIPQDWGARGLMDGY